MGDKAFSVLAAGGQITLNDVFQSVQEGILAELSSEELGNLGSQVLTELDAIAKAAGGDIPVSAPSGRAASEMLQAATDGRSDRIVVVHDSGTQDFFACATKVRASSASTIARFWSID